MSAPPVTGQKRGADGSGGKDAAAPKRGRGGGKATEDDTDDPEAGALPVRALLVPAVIGTERSNWKNGKWTIPHSRRGPWRSVDGTMLPNLRRINRTISAYTPEMIAYLDAPGKATGLPGNLRGKLTWVKRVTVADVQSAGIPHFRVWSEGGIVMAKFAVESAWYARKWRLKQRARKALATRYQNRASAAAARSLATRAPSAAAALKLLAWRAPSALRVIHPEPPRPHADLVDAADKCA
jgi:hypothetical protein